MARTAVWEQTVVELVRDRGDALHRYAQLLCGDPDDAADLVQDALVRTFGRLRNGFTVERAEAYVRRAILNAHLDRGRRASRWRRIAPLEYRPDRVEAPAGDTDRRLDLHEELGRLSPRERACVVLRYYDDLKVDDIAAQLGISSGAVKRYLSDGLAKMALALAADRPPSTRIDEEKVIARARTRRAPRTVIAGGFGGLAVLALVTPMLLSSIPTLTGDASGGRAESAEDPAADGADDHGAASEDELFRLKASPVTAAAEVPQQLRLALTSLGDERAIRELGPATVLITRAGDLIADHETEAELLTPPGRILPGQAIELAVELPPLPAGGYELSLRIEVVGADGSRVIVDAPPVPLRVE